jgi:hypothetical protein
MPQIDLDEDTFQKLAISARLMERPIGDVVRLLVQRLVSDPPRGTSSGPAPTNDEERAVTTTTPRVGWIKVSKTYLSKRVEAEFNPSTMEVRITTAPWSGKVFNSPTAAARAVVEKFGSNDRQTSNTNGRKFWHLPNGDDLRSVVGTRL